MSAIDEQGTEGNFVLGKNPQTTFVVIDEVDTDSWGIGRRTMSERRRQGL